MLFKNEELRVKVANKLLPFQVEGMDVPIFLDAPEEPEGFLGTRHGAMFGGLMGLDLGTTIGPELAAKMTGRVGKLLDSIPSKSGRVGAIKALLGGLGALVGLGLFKAGSEEHLKIAACFQACAKDPRIVKVASGMVKEAANPYLMGALAVPGVSALGAMTDVPHGITDIAGAGMGAYMANKAVQQYTPEMIQKLFTKATNKVPGWLGKLPILGSKQIAKFLQRGAGKALSKGLNKPVQKTLGRYAPWAGAGGGLLLAMLASDLIDWK